MELEALATALASSPMVGALIPRRRSGGVHASHPTSPAAGVAYVKYDRASSAALAIENLHEVTLNDGQGPRLKVMLADAPHTR